MLRSLTYCLLYLSIKESIYLKRTLEIILIKNSSGKIIFCNPEISCFYKGM